MILYIVLRLLSTNSTNPAPNVPLPFLISTAIIDALSPPASTSMHLPVKCYGIIIIFINYIDDADDQFELQQDPESPSKT